MELALERTGARDGAIFLVDEEEDALRTEFHIVGGVAMALPSLLLRRRKDGRPNGIAFAIADSGEPYLCSDTSRDPNYAAYFQDVASIAGAPILYQRRAIGVITVSSRKAGAFTQEHVDELAALAASAAKFMRRAQLHREKREGDGRDFLIKGLSPEWLEVERAIERVSDTTAPVLVRGESGTGKELVAHAIHFNSPRRRKPFVVVNCAAIPETLLESALFGHVRGAFTGATANRIGEFQKAHGGTLFLDEIGELTPPLQAKLLRAIEQGEIAPLGSDAPPRRVDVRLVAATNRDLEAMMRQGAFREDLYFRLSVVTLQLPPLRTFLNNLPILAQVFLHQANRRHGRTAAGFAPGAMACLQAHSYPGNLRELRNIVERAVIVASGPDIEPADLPPHLSAPAPRRSDRPLAWRELRERWVDAPERRYLEDLVASAKSVRDAARQAGVSVATLYRLLRRRGLRLGLRAERE
ncbi:MAG: sigma 54-interacting transcriptional regulator [Planctomycetes bacterium]|nr:sigma 54-interacting transcriptional regulator [Planctomycetota bacterium]